MGRVLGGTGDLQPADQANMMTTTDMETVCPFCGMSLARAERRQDRAGADHRLEDHPATVRL